MSGQQKCGILHRSYNLNELCSVVIPNITFPLADNFTYTVNENMAVTFTCQATGNPPPEITWMRNRAPLDQSNPQVTLREPKTELYSTGGGVNFIVSQTLTLDNTMDADSGIYTCVASNEVTSVTQNFELFVQGESELLVCVYVLDGACGNLGAFTQHIQQNMYA